MRTRIRPYHQIAKVSKYPLKGFLGDFVEFEHNEGDNDFTKIPHVNLNTFADAYVLNGVRKYPCQKGD